jgi:magnesium-transporting ATPase (P-type)
MNISLLAIVFISACSIGKPPFKVIQLLWMNLVMDILAAAAICTDPFVERFDENIPTLKRVGRKDKLITDVVWRNVLP